ncbi:MAG: hypothetical protein WAK58_23035, partial [Trebonia sp.]
MSTDCADAVDWATDGAAVVSRPADVASSRGAAECPVEPFGNEAPADGLAMCAIARSGPAKLPVTSTATTITAAAATADST